MHFLLLASVIWAFSFGLIGSRLAGLSPAGVSFARLFLSMLVLLPFSRARRGFPVPLGTALLAIGALQFGAMYLLYIASFARLDSYAVALFTVFTPIYVALLAYWNQPGRWPWMALATALAVAGAAAVLHRPETSAALWKGFLMMQSSNLCFAVGQLLYRRLMRRMPGTPDHQALVWMFAGAAAVTLPFAASDYRQGLFTPTPGQLLALLYLGVVASGVGFWLWNAGARRVRSPLALAVMNNAKIPLGVAASLLIFGERADPARLTAAIILMLLAIAASEIQPSRR